MIRYQQGNSYGNNFINGDEAQFADASLPRDRFGFRIANGVNTRQQDWKTANRGISMAQYTNMGGELVMGSNSKGDYKLATFRKSYTPGDIGSFTAASGATNTTIANEIGEFVQGTPYAEISNGNIRITKSGMYIVQAVATYYRPSGYSMSNSYQFWGMGMLMQLNKGTRTPINYQIQRACTNVDTMTTLYVGWLPAGDTLNIGMIHNYNNSGFKNAMVVPCLNLYRLS